MTHTEESLMALADEYRSVWLETSFVGSARDALRLAIREVLAERDELRKLQEHCLLGMKHCPQRSRAEKAEAECERLRKDAERLDWIDSRGIDGLHVEIAGGEYRMRKIVTVFGPTQKQDVQAPDIRTAIDAAIKDQP